MTGHQRERQAELRQRFSLLMGQEEETSDTPSTEEPSAAASTDTAPAAASKPAPKGRTRRASSNRSKPKATVAPMPVAQQQTDASRPQRLMVPLSRDEDRTLKELRLEDGVPAAARMRAMLQLYRTDQRYRRAVDRTVQQMR